MRQTLCLVALMSLTGCLRTASSWEGIWFIEVPVDDSYECESDIDENYKDADVPEGDDPVGGEWTYTEDFKGSNGGFFMQVLFEDGVAIGIVNDDVYVGREISGKTLTLTWESSEESEDLEEHESGYFFQEVVSGKVTETITLTKSEKNVYTGTVDVASDSSVTYVETDEWAAGEVQFGSGQSPSFLLTGPGNSNEFDADECSGDECEITVSSTCSGSTDVTATFVGKHNEGLYEGIQDADREPGLGGGGGTSYY
jgi:hypothetical protein